ncbi:MAG TPA: CotH kinase family protein [Bacteroidia bacterium]|nr:CotH kinase family protein [Bacteroidia bacterium]
MPHSRAPRRLWWWGLAALAAAAALLIFWPRQPRVAPSDDPYSFPEMQAIELVVGKKKMASLEARRDQALEMGILQEDDSSWVKAELIEQDRSWPVRIRLKGDWTDHLEGEKWSFRVELRGDGAWRRMSEFSLQSPERRGNLDEWLFHKVLAAENVLCPRYDFVYLRLNGSDLGTYAIEEHFAKELLESQGYREGPILRFDETGMWDARVAALRDSAFPYMQVPFQEAANVKPFKQKRTLSDSTLRQQFPIANQLMHQYRHGLADPGELFDLESVARQYALTDLFQAYHSLIWHNRRYYYNPVTSKLAPVVFDGFSGEGNDRYIEGPIWGYKTDGYHPTGNYHDLTGDFFFRDEGFLRAYYGHLIRYTQPAFLDSVFASLDGGLRLREDFLRSEVRGYHFDRAALQANAGRIRACLRDSVSEGRLQVVNETWDDGTEVLRLHNLNPFPVEVWLESDSARTLQMLPPWTGSADPCHGYIRRQPQSKIRCRLPGTALF